MKRAFSIIVTLALLVVQAESLIASDAPVDKATEIAAGKKLAEKLCARCHAVAKTGVSPNAKAPAFRTFVQKWPIENLEEALAEGIVVGEHIMPEFEFDPKDIASLLAYIDSLSE